MRKKNSSAPSPENGANNDVSSRETAEKSSKCVVGITIKTGESESADITMDVVHLVHSESPRQRSLSNFQKFEMKFSDGYNSDG